LLLALALHPKDVLRTVPAFLWCLVLTVLTHSLKADSVVLYLWFALGGVALVVWGVADRRTERVNVGIAIFALTFLAFYFSSVMDKLGRSASLMGLGLLLLLGGWMLEHLRRNLIARAEGKTT
jgi:uncharacterized membrane protein